MVFFTLSGISTTSGGVFYTNNDANPCVTGTPDTVSVTNPGTQTTTVSSSVILNIAASASDGDTVTSYSATGLPSGLSINTSTGVISGTPNSVGSSTVTVTASDNDESGSVTFTWDVVSTVVTPPPSSTIYGPGPISSFTDYSRYCLDNRNGGWFSGNELQLWTCGADGGRDQQAVLVTFGGHEVLGFLAPSGDPQGPWCVTGNGVGARLTITGCTGDSSQQISKRGPYYEFSDGTVMNDAGWGSFNGASVIDYGYTGARNERWSLP